MEAAFARDSDGLILNVVSMDVVIDGQWGSACNVETRAFWLRAALSGGPCETWSQGRFAEFEASIGREPRPLRSLEDLWGLPSLALKELSQVAVGNELLIFSIDLMICLACAEGVLEHPGEPKDPLKPSIWHLPIFQLLGQLPGFQVFDSQFGFSSLLSAGAQKLPGPTKRGSDWQE